MEGKIWWTSKRGALRWLNSFFKVALQSHSLCSCYECLGRQQNILTKIWNPKNKNETRQKKNFKTKWVSKTIEKQ